LTRGAPPRVLCVAPAWNEARRIGGVVRAVPRDFVTACLVVDDGSTDETGEVARREGALVVRHETNRGVGAAIRSGFRFAREEGFDVVVVVSGSGKTPPAQIPRLLAPILEGKARFVQGSRYLPGGEATGLPWHRRWGTRGYTWLFSLLARRRSTDASSGFRAIDLRLLDEEGINLEQPWLDGYELEPYLLFRAFHSKGAVMEVPVTIAYPPPDGAERITKMRPFFDWWRIFRPVIYLALGIRK